MTLLLFTGGFPYGNGEQFLETEILYLASAFRRVILVPPYTSGNARNVPSNVIVDTSLAHSRPSHWRRGLEGALRLSLNSLFYSELTANRSMLRHPAALIRLLSMFSDARRAQAWILDAYRRGKIVENDLVYTYWLGWPTLGAVLAKRRLPGLRIVSRAHSSDLYEERQIPPYLPFRTALLANLDAIYPVSANGAAYLRERWPSITDRVRVARLGVRDPGTANVPSMDGVLRIVSCSFLVEVKRPNLLVDALIALGERLPGRGIHWTHIGGGPLRGDVEGRASHELPRNVSHHFLGQVSNAHVLAFYRENPVDVFINVSAYEGIPVSIMEAQSFGIPVVATAVGGVPEIVTTRNGHLLPRNPTAADVAESLVQFAPDSTELQVRRAASRDTWSDVFDAERNYNSFCGSLRAVQRLRESERRSY